jgi:hypothetical protein
MSLDEENLDVLQNIEFATVSVYRENPALLDTAVMRALDQAIMYYNDVRRGHEPKPVSLQGDARQVFDSIRNMCDMRLGRAGDSDTQENQLAIVGNTEPEVIVACLRKLRKSVDRWNKQGGRQGYLKFVSQYVR